ncbi:hypothetical protein I79_018915 [Cricetulus griseus]|uniref:Uncharacterized protein n=1 Tax=Cricetulus griseus TaxID=10029 RepID=G3I604_CRIGR|nr:hypothetical protein I79_018915 [Cricetulus griseus]
MRAELLYWNFHPRGPCASLAGYVQRHAGHSGQPDSGSSEEQVCMGRGQAQGTWLLSTECICSHDSGFSIPS